MSKLWTSNRERADPCIHRLTYLLCTFKALTPSVARILVMDRLVRTRGPRKAMANPMVVAGVLGGVDGTPCPCLLTLSPNRLT
jgi:hypothetical protein